ncbi:MAG TPA: methyltransferase [Smithella sp.]|nr:methyltransferase [Smithella sp.]HRS98054.1 methyltransferase [Smithella sp.]
MQTGISLGIRSLQWFCLAFGTTIAHQVFEWFCWRTQLHGKLLASIFGKMGFPVYAFIFSLFCILRLLIVTALAIANRYTLAADRVLLKVLAVILTVPALYLFYSVARYFGLKRAMGIDHFDDSYRFKPLVREGIFRFPRNGMYLFGFLFLWAPALWFGSVAALCAALFNHLYIWVHYYTTELPDMKRIYDRPSKIF